MLCDLFPDHSATGFNAACDMTQAEHTWNTHEVIAEELKDGYFVRVEDADSAFPILPLHPQVLECTYIWWFDGDKPLDQQRRPNTLYVLVFC